MEATDQEKRVTDLIDADLRDFGYACTKRSVYDGVWEEIARRVLPHFSGTFAGGNQTPGAKKNQEQFDTTAATALWRFQSAMESMLTPASSRWSRFRPVDPILRRNREAMLWYDQLTDVGFHYRYSSHSGFQANQNEAYGSIGAFGTSCMFTDAFRDPTLPKAKGLRYRNIPIGEVFFATNHQGQVDTVFRRFNLTLRQVAQRWGTEKWPEALRKKLETKAEESVELLHVVRPNSEFEPGRLDRRGKRFASRYLLRSQRILLEEGGYRTMPYAVARYLTGPGEVYGRGPASMVLPSINVLNEEKKTVLKQGHRAVDPILLLHDDGILDGAQLRPGTAIGGGVSADGRALVHTLPVGNIVIGKDLMDDERLAINDAFLVTLFQVLIETPRMTATEVIQRAQEKGALLSPTMGRYQAEGLGPQHEREVDLLIDQGLIPPPPQIVIDAGAEYAVEYDAPLNRMMRAEEAAGIMRSAQWAAEIVGITQDPSPMDHFNWDVIMPDVITINGSPERYKADPEVVAAKREKRDQDQMAAQVTQALPGMAAMAKAASPEGTNPNPGQPR